jgi:hypothetical protein
MSSPSSLIQAGPQEVEGQLLYRMRQEELVLANLALSLRKSSHPASSDIASSFNDTDTLLTQYLT